MWINPETIVVNKKDSGCVFIRDTREHKDFGYDGVRICLDAGDYCIGAYNDDGTLHVFSDLLVIERKGRPDELCQNLGKFRERFEKELQKLRGVKFLYLVMEFSIEDLLKPKRSRLNSRFILTSIIDMCLQLNMTPVFCQDAQHAELFARTLAERVVKHHIMKKGD